MIEIYLNIYIREAIDYTGLPNYKIEIGSFQRNKFKEKGLQNNKSKMVFTTQS